MQAAELFDAIKSGDAEAVRTLAMASPALLKQTNKRGELPLLVASEAGNVPVVEALLDAGADPNGCSKAADGQTPLLSAVWGADDVMLQTLLKGGANPNAADARRRNAVHACALIGNRVLLEFLCDPAGFDEAAFKKVPRLDLKLLRDQDADGMTPLHYACAEVSASPHVASVLEYLVDENPDRAVFEALQKRSSSQRTPLHCVAGASTAGEETPRIAGVVARLAALGGTAVLSMVDEEGMTAAHVAMVSGAPKVFAALASASLKAGSGGVFTLAAADGRTLLHAAATHDSPAVVAQLLKSVPAETRAKLWAAKDKEGCTCLDIAAASGCLGTFSDAGAPEDLVTEARAAGKKTKTSGAKGGAPPRKGTSAKEAAAAAGPAAETKAKGDFGGAGHVAEAPPGESRLRMALLAFAVFATVTLPLLHTMLVEQGWL